MNISKLKVLLKRINIYDLLLSIFISIAICLSLLMVFTGDVFGSIHENYMKPFKLQYFILFLILIPVLIINIKIVYRFLLKLFQADDIPQNCEKNYYLSPRKKLVFTGIVLSVVWIIYYLSFYPGGLYIDTIVEIDCFQAGIIDNHYPIFYTFLVGGFTLIGDFFGKDLTWSIGLFFAFQMIVLGIEILALLNWQIKRGISEVIQLLSMQYMILFPLIPLYGASIWKDTPFSMAFLFWMMPFCDLCMELRQGRWTKKTVILNIIGFFLMSFTRNNGLYVVCFCALIIFIVCILKNVEKFALFLVIGALSLLSIVIIQKPIYNMVGVVRAPRGDGLCVPLQQICAVAAYDGNINDNQMERIHILAPQDNIKEFFIPGIADRIRWYAGIDWNYFGSKDFAKLWVELLPKNLKIYVNEYLILTAGYWNVRVTSGSAYTNTFSWNPEYAMEHDYFYDITGVSFKSFIEPKRHISAAWFFWVFFVGMFFCMKRFGWRSMVFYSPAIGVWVTIMIASVISCGLRFVSPLVFTLPFVLIIPSLLKEENN